MIDGRMVDGIINLFFFMAVLLLIFVPLGIWKLIELIMSLGISVKVVIP